MIRRHLSAAALGCLMLAAGSAVIPGEVFVRFRLDVTPGPDGAPQIVVQSRTALVDRTFSAKWHAEVERIEGDGTVRSVCQGAGRGLYTAPAAVYRAPLAEWVGDPDCRLVPGEIYRLAATWTFTLGFVPRQTSAASAVFTAQ